MQDGKLVDYSDQKLRRPVHKLPVAFHERLLKPFRSLLLRYYQAELQLRLWREQRQLEDYSELKPTLKLSHPKRPYFLVQPRLLYRQSGG
jgi:hypothetical protein